MRQRKTGPRFDIKLLMPPKKMRRTFGRWIRRGRMENRRNASKFLVTEDLIALFRENRRIPQRHRFGDSVKYRAR